ncbi:hypothetical protein RF11_00419 [Thelohanellus kitauei]|uniref:Uncharacterized protein n=1 Tax=Thelohanellus kitauei TaxID=669202 RepID=A0A0C2IVZ7_THEKT|nr:hypothetical protein RF11_00419 [Thelohanellus kitauei]
MVHFCTDFTSTASATVSTYVRVVLRRGTLLQAVKLVQGSHLLNTQPYPQPTRATIPSWHSFAGKLNAEEDVSCDIDETIHKIPDLVKAQQDHSLQQTKLLNVVHHSLIKEHPGFHHLGHSFRIKLYCLRLSSGM